jgi:hypothetical protein
MGHGSPVKSVAVIGGAIWLRNIRVRLTALSAKRSVPLKDTSRSQIPVAAWHKVSALYVAQR